jgi:hypothetical protein
MKPNAPATPYRVVGTIIVTPPSANAAISSYIAVLKEKAAAIGADGVASVEATPRTMTNAVGGCISGTPYYSQRSSTAYDVKGDAFVWSDSLAVTDTVRLDLTQLDSLERSRHASNATTSGWTHSACLVGMGVCLVAVVVVILNNVSVGIR